LSRRKACAIGASLAVLVAAPALAVSTEIVPWFRGQPAPPTVQASFGRLTEHALPSQIGERIIVEQARGVIAINSPAGVVRLWTAPTQSGGRCRLIQFGDGTAARDYAFNCMTLDPTSPFTAGFSRFPGRDEYAIVDGQAAAHVSKVGVEFKDGSRRTIPIVDGYFLAVVNDPQPKALFFEHTSEGVTRTSTFDIPA